MIQVHHDDPLSGYFGVDRTTDLLRRTYYWPTLAKDVNNYVKSCDTCQRNKAVTQAPAGLLKPIDVPRDRWDVVTMDFVGPLPTSVTGNNFIFVIIDKLTKMGHFVPCQTQMSASQIATLFFTHVVKLHGLPRVIISDRDSKFLSSFWTSLFSLMGTELRFSTAYHPQTYGQTERLNRTLEDTLRAYVSSSGTDWEQHLPAVEFAYNNSQHSVTKHSPFFLNYGRHPRLPHPVNNLADQPNPSVSTFVFRLMEALGTTRRRLLRSHERMRSTIDPKRRPDTFSVGDWVLLSTKNLRFRDGLTRKLVPRFVGPFKIVSCPSSVTYELQLPVNMKIFPKFHIQLLKRYHSRGVPRSIAAPNVTSDNELTLEPEYIIRSRFHPSGQRQCLVKWKHFAVDDATWVFLRDLASYPFLFRS